MKLKHIGGWVRIEALKKKAQEYTMKTSKITTIEVVGG